MRLFYLLDEDHHWSGQLRGSRAWRGKAWSMFSCQLWVRGNYIETLAWRRWIGIQAQKQIQQCSLWNETMYIKAHGHSVVLKWCIFPQVLCFVLLCPLTFFPFICTPGTTLTINFFICTSGTTLMISFFICTSGTHTDKHLLTGKGLSPRINVWSLPKKNVPK